MLESLIADFIPPGDWKQLARAYLWGEGASYCGNQNLLSHVRKLELNRAQNLAVTFEMLAGEGQYQETLQQLEFDPGVYAQVNAAAKRAWYKLPSTGRQTADLSKIRQGSEGPFQDFVDRLLQTASRLGDADAGLLLVKQLAYENANSACQAALRPFRKKGNLSDYVRLCSDREPAYTQGLAMSAALQGKTVKEVLFQQRKPVKGRASGPSGSCYRCGRSGHQVKQCPNRQKSAPQGPSKGGQ